MSWSSRSWNQQLCTAADVEPNTSLSGHAVADILGARVEGLYRTCS